jgi:hypothetical protein
MILKGFPARISRKLTVSPAFLKNCVEIQAKYFTLREGAAAANFP